MNHYVLKGNEATATDEEIVDLPGEEMAIEIKGGRIPLSTIEGYELLGDFEDRVERFIGV